MNSLKSSPTLRKGRTNNFSCGLGRSSASRRCRCRESVCTARPILSTTFRYGESPGITGCDCRQGVSRFCFSSTARPVPRAWPPLRPGDDDAARLSILLWRASCWRSAPPFWGSTAMRNSPKRRGLAFFRSWELPSSPPSFAYGIASPSCRSFQNWNRTRKIP